MLQMVKQKSKMTQMTRVLVHNERSILCHPFWWHRKVSKGSKISWISETLCIGVSSSEKDRKGIGGFLGGWVETQAESHLRKNKHMVV